MRILVLTLVGIVGAWAEVPRASVSGTITDSSGAVLPGATITVHNVETGVSRSTTSNESGNYQLLGLQAGRYDAAASRPQFTTVQRKDITLRVGDEVRIDLTLPTGEASESLLVTETTQLVQVQRATASTVVGERAIQDLPTDGR